MQNQNNSPLGSDPTTSSPSTGNNSGESTPQTGKKIVNEQEQNKPVNQEEFIDDVAQNTKDANEQADDGSLPPN